MSEKERLRILVVDDHPVVREGLRALLERQPDLTVVAEAADGEEAVAEFRRHRPDVTLMDLRLRGLGGVEAVERICAEFPASRVLVLTTYDGDEEIYQALRAGARGYVLKGAPAEELLRAIRAVHGGAHPISPEAAARLAERMLDTDLTPREVDVLRLVARGRSNKEIGAALAVTESTVKAYLHQIFGKMGVTDRTEAATQAIKRGIVRLD
ncbi:MAG TPA: response regulator transcription factor [Vicinamibacteria bacterium]|nr:response regulator transcription factor [Vicinamibacteria bacterium]